MDLSFLPLKIGQALNYLDLNGLYEIRLRADFPIKINYKNKIYYLCESGISNFKLNGIKISKAEIAEIILNITERSLYAHNDRLKEGFLTTKDGLRVGVAGECVFDNDKIITIKNFSSLNIRIPHDIKDCSKQIYNQILTENILNVLIISPPFKGKTTIIKDIASKLNNDYSKSILIIDERGELKNICGENIDVISFCDKTYAFNYAIRSMSPNIVIMDELSTKNDWECAFRAVNSGVNLIATAHGSSIENIKNKSYFIDKIFDRYVVLDSIKPSGTLNSIYDGEFNLL